MGKLLRFLEKNCPPVLKKYWTLENGEILNLTIFILLVFCNYVVLGRHIVNISKAMFTKLIFNLRVSDQLPDILLQGFYIHWTSLVYLCIYNNFNMLISKAIANFSLDIDVLANLLLETLGFRKKSKYSLLLKVNVLL